MSWASVARGERRGRPAHPPPKAPAPSDSAELHHVTASGAWPAVGQGASPSDDNKADAPKPSNIAWQNLKSESLSSVENPDASASLASEPTDRESREENRKLVDDPPLSPVADVLQAPEAAALLPSAQFTHVYHAVNYYIAMFQARPNEFYHQFMTNLGFRQAVVSSGLTFDPHCDPNRPVLLNLYSHVFGMPPAFGPTMDSSQWRFSRQNAPSQGSPRAGSSPAGPPGFPDIASMSEADDSSSNTRSQKHSSPGPTPELLIPAVRDLFAAAPAMSPIAPLPMPVSPTGHPLGSPMLPLLHPAIPGFVHDASHVPTSPFSRQTPDSFGKNGASGDFSGADKRKDSRGRFDRERRKAPPRTPRPGRVTRRSNDPLPLAPTVSFLSRQICSMLDQAAYTLLDQIMPPEDENYRRNRLLAHMNKVVRNEWTGASVRIFGSGGNGLGLRSGDVDMCLMVPKSGAKRVLRGKVKPQNDTQIMKRMAELLRRNKMENLQELPRARVPILKMRDPVSKFHIDMCLNNELVSHNTDLLGAYAALDDRVRPLCLLVKYWAKRRGVNETYRGTLSSYAYVLLVINFLQTRQPPVLPCLQRMVNGRRVARDEEIPVKNIGNSETGTYNVYFDRSRPSFLSKNKASVGTLFAEFFRYYAYDFDYDNHLVSVRCGRVLGREERNWDRETVRRESEAAEKEFWEQSLLPPIGEPSPDLQKETNGGHSQTDNATLERFAADVDTNAPPEIHTPTEAQSPSIASKENEDFGLARDLEGMSIAGESKPVNSASNKWKGTDFREFDGEVQRLQENSQGQKVGDSSGNSSPAARPQSAGSNQNSGTPGPGQTNSRDAALRLRKPTRFVERHLFCIEDPFNLSHDLSRIVDEETLLVIRQELVRAYEILSTQGDLLATCEKWE